MGFLSDVISGVESALWEGCYPAHGVCVIVTTRPYDAQRDDPLSRRQTRHNERSSEAKGNALRSLFYYLSNLEPAMLGISTSDKALSCFPPIIGNLNIATISHLASL